MRTFARVTVDIWADADWRARSPLAQWLYFYMLTSPELSLAGHSDWRPGRVAAKSDTLSKVAVEAAAMELEESRFIYFDDDTEECLIRSFIRNDGLLKQPKMGVAVFKAYGAISSAKLREVLAAELVRLRAEYPDLGGWTALIPVLRKGSENTT